MSQHGDSPDASLLVIGGHDEVNGSGWDAKDGAAYRTIPERFVGSVTDCLNPGSWEAVAEMDSERGYHSTALLLPDGKVLSAGSNYRTWDYQVYSPPYLDSQYDPVRPELSQLNVELDLRYGQQSSIRYPTIAGVSPDRVVLMRPGSITHHFDYDMRYVRLPITGVGITFTVPQKTLVRFRAPANSKEAPEGYYMLFLVTDDGIPCERARWVHLH